MANELTGTLKSFLTEAASAVGFQNLALSELSPISPPNSSELQKALDSNVALPGASIALESGSPNLEPQQRIESQSLNPISEAAEMPENRASAITNLEMAESTDSDRLTPELKTAVNNSSKVIVRMPPCNTTRGDIVINRDGTIVHYLNLDHEKNGAKNFVIALEKGVGSDSGLSAKQTETLKGLISYTTARNKEFSVQFSDSLPGQAGKTPAGAGGRAQRQTRTESSKAKSSSGSSKNLPSESGETVGDQPGSAAYPTPRSFDQPANHRTVDNTRSIPQREWTPVNLFDLLMDWFGSDPETFKKLMPGLFKKGAANGKLDPTKLRKLLDSNDPLVSNLKSQIPHLTESFPSAKQSNSSHVSSADNAVNKTGAVLADKAARVSEELDSSGYCAKGVSFAIERATGKVIWGNANDMRESLPDQGFSVAKSKELKVGQVVHVYWTPEVYAQEQARRGPCPNYGDIAIIGKGRDGQLYAYNDAATPLNNYLQKSRYDWNTLKVFNPPSV